MGLGNNQPGFNSVGEYTISGLPWVTSSIGSSTTQQWAFHHVTREVSVLNLGGGVLAVGFSANGVAGNNRFQIPPSGSASFNVRTTQLYARAVNGAPEYSIFASLTLVPSGAMPPLSGSGQWEGI